jgi:SHS2 domain-containing protein
MTRRDVVVRGASLEQAFREAALAVFALAVDTAAVSAADVREVRAHGAALEALLAQWIDECSYVYEIEGFACRELDFAVFDVEPKSGGEPMRLHALLRGSPVEMTDSAVRIALSTDRPIRSVNDGYEIRLVVEA